MPLVTTRGDEWPPIRLARVLLTYRCHAKITLRNSSNGSSSLQLQALASHHAGACALHTPATGGRTVPVLLLSLLLLRRVILV
jgi:hypothetical protein